MEGNKENTKPSLKMASIPYRSRAKASRSKKRPNSDSDSEDTPPPRNTKRVCKTNSFNLQTFLEDEREQREGFQKKMLSEIEKGNEQFVKSAESTKAFQTDFLSLIGKAFASHD